MATFEIISGGGGSSSVVGYPEGTKMYVALLTQSGTDAPVAKVLVNTLGGTLVLARIADGQYSATLSGVFTQNKTCFPTTCIYQEAQNGDYLFTQYLWNSANVVFLRTVNVLTNNTQEMESADNAVTVQILVFP